MTPSPSLFLESESALGTPNSPLTREQLVKLSRSPIAKRLHITKADYAIPIPFTLELPPRLSKSAPSTPLKERSSPSSSPKRSPKRLLFSGAGYEPAGYSSGSESEPDRGREYNPYLNSPKPPRITQSRKKVAKFVQKSNTIPADQLSMIEESSTRTNSVNSKTLPTLPDLQDEGISSPSLDFKLLGARGPSLSRKLTRKPPPDWNQKSSSTDSPFISSSPISTADSSFKGAERLETKNNADTTLKPMDLSALAQSMGNLTVNVAQSKGNVSSQQAMRSETSRLLPHTPAVRHALHLSDESAYRLGTRTFSEESHVSSVSSFNSFGDMNSFRFGAGPSEKNEGEQVLRQSSIMTTSSASSWNSLQRSLDVSLKKTLSSMSPSPEKDTPEATKKLPELPLEDIEDKTIEIAPLSVSKHHSENSLLPTDDNEDEVTEQGEDSSNIGHEDELLDSFGSLDYNNGDGRSFIFPNDLSNITNSTSLKPRRKVKSGSSYSLVSPTGQITIPDLEKDTLHYKTAKLSQLNNHLSDQLMEPIGFPGKAAKEHFRIMYNGLSTDSDSDSSFNSQFSKLQGNIKTKQRLQQEKNVDQCLRLPSVSSKSPVRHSRRRSMYNIQFESEFIEPSVHTRSKSTMDIQDQKRVLKPTELNKNLFQKRNIAKQEIESVGKSASPNYDPQDSNVDDTLKDIVIAEPPAKVNYPVDFRSASDVPKKPYTANYESCYDILRIASRGPEHSRNNVLNTYPVPSNTYSEQASSYNSSQTAGETLSTAPTDPGSITIDLTKDDYDVCMIKRNDSTMSYKSVIEKTKDGQKVEVVLVEEDEEPSNLDRDDLLSIYSRYMGTWEPAELKRADSTQSYVSDVSEGSAVSWAASDAKFRVKSITKPARDLPPAIAPHQAEKFPTKPVYNAPKIFVNQKKIPAPISLQVPRLVGSRLPALNKKNFQYAEVKALPQVLAPPQAPKTRDQSVSISQSKSPSHINSSYFDYSSNATYDFKSFIHQRNPKGLSR